MAQLLIRNIDPDIIKRLKLRAKQHHRSLQGELKLIVESAAKLSKEETLQLSKKWHARLEGRAYIDSEKLQREDREG